MADQFRVIYLESVKQQIKVTFRRFRNTEMEEPLVRAAGIIDASLQSNPREFGDPCYSAKQLKLDLFVRAVFPLIVDYGVHQTEPLVFVNGLDVFDR